MPRYRTVINLGGRRGGEEDFQLGLEIQQELYNPSIRSAVERILNLYVSSYSCIPIRILHFVSLTRSL